MAELWWLWRIAMALVFMAHGIPTHPAQEKTVLEEKVSQLMAWTKKNRVIKMTDPVFIHFVLETPRNYSVTVMFTVLEEFRSCVTCEEAAEEFHILADSWQHSGSFANKVFFVLMDYNLSPEVFWMFRVTSVPTFFHFSADREFTPDDIYNLDGRGFTAEEIGEWVAERMNVYSGIQQPTIYHGPFMLGTVLTITGGLVYLLERSRTFVFCRIFGGFVMLCFVIVMTSGQMWIHIKQEPYVRTNPKTGHIRCISELSYSQYTPETYIVALCNMWITLGVMLVDKAATSRTKIVQKEMMCVTGMCLAVLFFSGLLSLFRFKVPEYPYRLLTD
ncbi:magnesium transporter protein 1-like [Lemur catta]|uniref:magnesium transporter protein 1-like n=1 Tax=Lemur catta TaxID=9447 RepID=UPI001E26D3EF|nr:magnesium transporter protein 1-like [Lemur catta]XP_045404231.1 magnesium transporter protein 1-like [Lemur catta]